jgi:hypothetical protein
MTDVHHPNAPHHLPPFITAPGQADVLMVIVAVLLVLFVLGVGVLFFRLHHLPEHLAHKGQKTQYEIVAVLGLLAMFTHIHLFWVAALLLAIIDFPDFGGLLGRIARSLEKMAGIKRPAGGGSVQVTGQTTAVAPEDAPTGDELDDNRDVPQDVPVAVSTLRPRH